LFKLTSDCCYFSEMDFESPYGPVVLQTPHFTASNSHMTPHQMQKMKKSSTTSNQNEKYPNKEKPTQHERPSQTHPGRDPRWQWVLTHAGRGSGQTHAGSGSGVSPAVTQQRMSRDSSKSTSKLDSNA
jgi:hypothetical protein